MLAQKAYGLWPSLITPSSLAQGKRLSDLAWDSSSETLVWLEDRSDRGVLVSARMDGQARRDLTDELSVRARVGYGGGALTAAHGQVIFASGGRLYRQSLAAGAAHAITPAFGAAASPRVSPDGRWVLFVHSYEEDDSLGLVDIDGRWWPQKLVQGHDFYMQPAWHPSGERIAWIAWDHPNMPWDGTALFLGTLREQPSGRPALVEEVAIAGDETTSLFEPEFSPDGRLLSYVSDESGWWNLYLYDLESGQSRPLVLDEAELGAAAWVQAIRTHAWSPDGNAIYYCRSKDGVTHLWRVDVASGETDRISALEAYTHVAQVQVSIAGKVALLASSSTVPGQVLVWDPADDSVRVAARSSTEIVPSEQLARPENVSWETSDHDRAHGLLYLPIEGSCKKSTGRPPLIVIVHGGPTGQATAKYMHNVQFFTTRGYAVLDLNYRGSSGFGRAFRSKLRGKWGLYDADDAVNGARHLAERGLVDPDRMVIMGGSAGGYTVLQTLIRYPGAFKAGLCLYGVTNLFTLASDTHKFEQHYLDSMIGPLPEACALYRERSPIFSADKIRDPIAIFQGEEDRVVPMAQAESIVKALQKSGVAHEYHLYPGEGHGWRRSETIESFYSTVERFLRDQVLFS